MKKEKVSLKKRDLDKINCDNKNRVEIRKRNLFKIISKQIVFSFICLIFFLVFCGFYQTANAQISVGEVDSSRYYTVTSLDGFEVKIPHGFVPSGYEDERYVNGKKETKKGNIIASLSTTPTDENFVYVTSENYSSLGKPYNGYNYWTNKEPTLSYLSTSTFTIRQNGGVIDYEWTASHGYYNSSKGEFYVSSVYLYKITNGVEKIVDVLDCTTSSVLGSNFNNIGYRAKKYELEQGTYKISFAFKGNDGDLGSLFVKKCNVIQYDEEGSCELEVRIRSGGFVIYEGEDIDFENTSKQTIQENYNQFVYVPVKQEDMNMMYLMSGGKYYINNLNYNSLTNKVTSSNSGVLISRGGNIQNSLLKYYVEGIGKNTLLESINQETVSILNSAITYGCFYVGRYESSSLNTNSATVMKNKSSYGTMWATSYRNHQNISSSATTSLICTSQWFFILKWLVDTEEKMCYDINLSIDCGNYAHSEYINSLGILKTAGQYVKLFTGTVDKFACNQIYDMGGNHCEYSLNLLAIGDFYRWDNKGVGHLSVKMLYDIPLNFKFSFAYTGRATLYF